MFIFPNGIKVYMDDMHSLYVVYMHTTHTMLHVHVHTRLQQQIRYSFYDCARKQSFQFEEAVLPKQ